MKLLGYDLLQKTNQLDSKKSPVSILKQSIASPKSEEANIKKVCFVAKIPMREVTEALIPSKNELEIMSILNTT